MILCCGEALIDMIPAPTAVGRDGYVPNPGGAVFNTAIALGRLGVAAGLCTGLSTDVFGEILLEALGESNVDTSLIVTSDRPTTLAFVTLQGGHASYRFYDENSAGRMLAEADLPPLPAHVEALYAGGISLACEPAADAYGALVADGGATRAVMLDPNIRPQFIQNPGQFHARLNRILAASDIVKVSDEDLDWIFPGSDGLDAKISQLRATGPSIVILTQGSAGATAYLQSGEEVRVNSHAAQVVDTVGAGDTFNAGVLASLSQQGLLTKAALANIASDDMARALNHGARVAAVTVSRAGANPPWHHELTG